MSKVHLDLKPVPDAYGFIYGRAQRGNDVFDVNVLPPKSQWRGQFKLDGYTPDEHDWILYVDGEEVARLRERTDIEGAVAGALKWK